MKMIMAAVMALALAASMTACGNVDEDNTANTQAAAVSAEKIILDGKTESADQVSESEELSADTNNSTGEKSESKELPANKNNSTARTSESEEISPDTNKEKEIEAEEVEYGTNMTSGGWAVISGDMSIDNYPEAKAALEKSIDATTGAEYEPFALLGTQVVAGTNYCILCRTTPVFEAIPSIELVYVYEDLDENASITGRKALAGIAEPFCGGSSANEGDISLDKNPDIRTAFDKALEGFTGASYEPVAYVGSQVVAGTNYLILCKSSVLASGAQTGFSLVTVYKDLEGNSELSRIEDISLGDTDGIVPENV